MAAFNYYINRILTLLVTKQAKQQEWKIKLATAKNNKFTRQNIHNLQKKLRTKQKRKKSLKYDNTTNQEMDNIHILQPTNTKNYKTFQTS